MSAVLPAFAASSAHGARPATASTPAQRLAKAAATTAAAKTMHVSFAGAVDVAGTSGGSGKLRLTGSGAEDIPLNEAQLHFSVSGLTGQAPIALDELETGGNLYLSLGSLMKQIAPGKSWIEVPLAGAGVAGSSAANPAAILPLLEASGNKVTDQGTVSIAGVKMQSYAVTLSPAEVLGKLKSLKGVSATQLSQAEALLKAGAFTFTAAVGPEGDINRISVHVAVAQKGESVKTDIAVALSDFGAAVSVPAAPAASAVVPESQLGSLGLGSALAPSTTTA